MLEFDKRFANKSLTHSELLRQFSFYNLIPGLERTGQDRFLQCLDNAYLLGDWLQFLKNRT